MDLTEILDIYQLITASVAHISTRNDSIAMRKHVVKSSCGFTKVAFDTRRVNQETDYIPRKILQNYSRSDKYVSDNMAIKLQAFSKVLNLTEELKLKYGAEPAWQDSYTRVLASSIQNGLRTVQKDGDFSDSQPSMGSLAYLEELMFVRYRLTVDGILQMNDEQIKAAILSRDEFLTREYAMPERIIKPQDVEKFSYDQMLNQVLTNVVPVAVNQEINKQISTNSSEKKITITISV